MTLLPLFTHIDGRQCGLVLPEGEPPATRRPTGGPSGQRRARERRSL